MPVVTEIAPEAARAAARAYLAAYLRPPAYQASWALQGFGPDDWAQAGQRPARRRDGGLGRHAGHLAPLARPA